MTTTPVAGTWRLGFAKSIKEGEVPTFTATRYLREEKIGSICNNLQGVPVSQEEQLCSAVKAEFTLHTDQMVGDNNNNEKLVVNNMF